MQAYHWGVILFSFFVDFLLLYGGSLLARDPAGAIRCLAGASAGAIHSGLCLWESLCFLGNPLWRAVRFLLMALLAYGLRRSTCRRGAVFAILSLALSGLAQGIGNGGILSLLAAVLGIAVLYVIGFRDGISGKFVPVEICSGDTKLQLRALRDTGNTLRDPIMGRPVLVIGADAAQKLTGLSYEQLRTPVEAIDAIPGLQLIPYRSIDREHGLMLARNYHNVRIGKWRGSSLVAFAPERLSGDYEALTGGTI